MTELRQLPLFATLPLSTTDLNPRSRFKDSVTLFQSHLLKEGKSDHTIKAFTADLQLLAAWGGDEVLLGNYTTSMLNEFLNWLEFGRGVSCSRKTYARRVTTLKVFFKWLAAVKAIPHDPANAILQRSGAAPLAEVLDPYEITMALRASAHMRRNDKPDARPELLFRLLVDTGIKKAETANLLVEHILRDGESPRLIVRHKSPKNVYKERLIDLDPAWLPVYDRYAMQYHPADLVFNCTARNLEYVLEDVGKLAGIENKLSFEMMRWTCAMRDFRGGDDPEAIREKLGLSKISWQETFMKIKRLTAQQIEVEQASV